MKTISLTTLTTLTLIFFLAIGIASVSPKKAYYKNPKDWAPINFNPKDIILLVAKHPDGDRPTANMIAHLTKYYPYRFEVVDESFIKEMGDEEYGDTVLYRFGIIWYYIESRAAGSTMASYNLYGKFFDRALQKEIRANQPGNIYGRTGYKVFINTIIGQFGTSEK
jgi:hypothetical protein